jgi:hypothetical protein
MRNIFGLAIFAALYVALCGVSFAEETEIERQLETRRVLQSTDLPDRRGIKVSNDKAVIHAAFNTEEQLDTNVFYSNTDRQFDSITILRPSVGFEVPFGPHRMSADYEISPHYYATYHDQSHVDHLARALLDIRMGEARITAKDTFRIFTDRAANEDSLRLKETVNTFRVGVEAELNKMTYDAGYSNIIQAYDSTDLWLGNLTYEAKDYVENVIDASMSYRFMPKTDVVIENDFGLIHYYNTSQVPGSWYNETLVGFKGAWFPKMSMNFKAGFRYQSYEYSQVICDKSYIGLVMRGGFMYKATEKDTLTLSLDRTIDESIYTNMNYYIANLIGLDYKHEFTDKFSARLYGSYQLHQYPGESNENGLTAKRMDNFLQGGLSLRYDITRWASVEIGYVYTNKFSNFDVYSYYDNLVSLRGTVGF